MRAEQSSCTTLVRATFDLAVGCPKKWQLRNCRRIGATFCRDAHLPTDMAIAWLGQSARGTNKFYTGEAKEDYLQPLVRAIHRTYFR